MSEPTLEQMNEAIALFMGMKRVQDKDDPAFEWEWVPAPAHSNWCFYHPPPFDRSWDWLMPVVSKIETIENGRFGFTVDPWGIEIIDYKECYEGKTEVAIVTVTREFEKGMDKEEYLKSVYYEAVTEFLLWNNKQKEANNEGN